MTQDREKGEDTLAYQLVERLERSYEEFRRTLTLLEEEEYARPCLANGWTPAATVAHVAFWDDYQRRRMEAALRGGGPIGSRQESNDQRAANEYRSWDVVVAEADAARAKLIEFAGMLTEEQLEADYGEGQDRGPLLARVLRHMPRHVEEHKDEVKDYCLSLERWGREGFLAFYRRQFDNFLNAIGGLTEQDCIAVAISGEWSVRELLAHVLVWDEYVWEVIKRWPEIDQSRLDHWSDPTDDVGALNARMLDAKADLSMIDLLDGLATFHRRIVGRCRRLSVDALEKKVEYGWEGAYNVTGLLHTMAAHTAEHAAEIYAARADGRLVPVRLKR